MFKHFPRWPSASRSEMITPSDRSATSCHPNLSLSCQHRIFASLLLVFFSRCSTDSVRRSIRVQSKRERKACWSKIWARKKTHLCNLHRVNAHHDDAEKTDVNQLCFLLSTRRRCFKSVYFVTTVGFHQPFLFPALASNLPAPSTQAPFLFSYSGANCTSFATIYFVAFREFASQKLQ